jgi:hypothetical protein
VGVAGQLAEQQRAWLLSQVMHRDLLNANVLKAQYAVRGELYLKAEELKEQGRKIIATNSECRRF